MLAEMVNEQVPNIKKTDITNRERALFSYGRTPEATAMAAIDKGVAMVTPNYAAAKTLPKELFCQGEEDEQPAGHPKGSANEAKNGHMNDLESCRVEIVNELDIAKKEAKAKEMRLPPGELTAIVESSAGHGV